ncbi:hypothetical protein [Actinomadura oligospora]|uniref:hypothetical protein n=1 Tax=Actinomadura oligospora TaxID=111804 RepID=UPI0004B4E841|nr:hypothetical protein [Actinomadura oligospora]
MPKSWMIADFLRPYAQWRIERAEERDDGRNARAAIGLIDAAAYAMQMDDSDRLIAQMATAGCFAFERFNPGTEGERLIRRWHYDDTDGAPRDLFAALADAAERGVGPSPAPPASRAAGRWRHLDRGDAPSRRSAGAPDPRLGDAPTSRPAGAPDPRLGDAPSPRPAGASSVRLSDSRPGKGFPA